MEHLIWFKYLLKEEVDKNFNPADYDVNSYEYHKIFIQYLKNKYFKKQFLNILEKEVLDNFSKLSEPFSIDLLEKAKGYDLNAPVLNTGLSIYEFLKDHVRRTDVNKDSVALISPNIYIYILRKKYLGKENDVHTIDTLIERAKYSLANFYHKFCLKFPNKAISIPRLNKVLPGTKNRTDNLELIKKETGKDIDIRETHSILDDIKITEYVSRGAFGTVYKLEDGRVLKIFKDSVSLNKDLERMELVTNELFSAPKEGEASRVSSREMPFFDYGKLGGRDYYYSIMPLIIPLNKAPWYDRSPVFEMIADLNQDVSRSFESNDQWDVSYKDYKDEVMRKFGYIARYRLIGKEKEDPKTYSNTIEKIIKASYRAFVKFKGTDTHSGNIGYLPQKPNQFFYFDM